MILLVYHQVLDCLNVLKSPTLNHSIYKEWLIDFFNKNDTRNKNLLAVAIWAIWFVRNRVIHNGLKQRSQNLAGFILGYIQEIDGLPKDTNFN